MRHVKKHMQARYPGGDVVCSENSMEVWDADGKLAVHMERNGAGQWVQVDGHSDFSLSHHGFETSNEGEKHREKGLVYEHSENVKRRKAA